MRALAGLAALLLLAACGDPDPTSQPAVEKEVTALAPVGADQQAAQAALQRAGFGCGPVSVPTSPADRECIRFRSYKLLEDCVQRVYLTFDPSGQRLAKVEVFKPSCPGQ